MYHSQRLCGIAGVLRSEPGPIDPSFARKLAHRGPDDEGWLLFDAGQVLKGREFRREFHGQLLFSHHRLSIIDLSPTGRQPMSYLQDRYHITFNGEIYNYLELKDTLSKLGHRFVSTSDTEVLLAAYAEWGAGMLKRLVGMFAFAILDVQKRNVFIARDCFGIKPLYLARYRDGLAFASEIKALLELPGVGRGVRAQSVYDFLNHRVSDSGGRDTFFRDIEQLPPASFCDISLSRPTDLRPQRYWRVDLAAQADCSFEEAAAKIRELLLKNVLLHLRSDVAVGGTLSGGLDSSSIVMALRQLRPDAELHTFSVVADDPRISEAKWIDIVRDAANSVSHTTRLTLDEFHQDLERLVHVQEEPFGGTSMYAEYRVHRLIRNSGLKVVLVGDGGDELFAGYPLLLGARLASLLAQREIGRAAGFAAAASRFPGMSLLRVVANAADCSLPAGNQAFLRRMIGRDFYPRWMDGRWFRDQDIQLTSKYFAEKEKLRPLLHRMLTQSSLPTHLRSSDRNAMAHSVESRLPFLTPQLVEFVFALPERYFISEDGTTKSLLRAAMDGLLPPAIQKRRDKIGFATDELELLRGRPGWARTILSSEHAAAVNGLKLPEILASWDRMEQGRERYDPWIWRCLSLILWARQFNVDFGARASSDLPS